MRQAGWQEGREMMMSAWREDNTFFRRWDVSCRGQGTGQVTARALMNRFLSFSTPRSPFTASDHSASLKILLLSPPHTHTWKKKAKLETHSGGWAGFLSYHWPGRTGLSEYCEQAAASPFSALHINTCNLPLEREKDRPRPRPRPTISLFVHNKQMLRIAWSTRYPSELG